MKYCKYCGTSMPNESKFCPGCGSNQMGEVKETVTPTYNQMNVNMGEPLNKGMAVLGYFFPLIMYLVNPKEDFARFHIGQAMNLLIWQIIYTIGSGIISAIVPEIRILLSLGALYFTVCMIMGIVYSVQGERKKLPLVGDIEIIKQRNYN